MAGYLTWRLFVMVRTYIKFMAPASIPLGTRNVLARLVPNGEKA